MLVQTPVCVLASWEKGALGELVVFFCRNIKVLKLKIVILIKISICCFVYSYPYKAAICFYILTFLHVMMGTTYVVNRRKCGYSFRSVFCLLQIHTECELDSCGPPVEIYIQDISFSMICSSW